MREVILGGLKVRLTGGPDREGGGDGPVVVLLHGFGAPGDDLVALWRVLDVPHPVRFAFPEAPMSLPQLGFGARAWWPLDVEALQAAAMGGRRPSREHEDPEGMAEARGKVIAMLDALQRELEVAPERVVLGGFSQGAMLSLDVALSSERPLAALVLLSTTLLARTRWQAAMAARASLPIFQSHGRRDPLLPFAEAEKLRGLLQDAGCPVQWVEFGGQHEIPMDVLVELSAFLRRVLDEGP
jgi:phospholipase/carboxylesterase